MTLQAPDGAPERPGTHQGSNLFLAWAHVVTLLAEHDGLRSFSLPYPREAQHALDRTVLHCLNHGRTPPKSLPELLSWCTLRNASDPLFDVPHALVTPDARLIHPVGLMPTRTCLELAPFGRPGRAEQDALDSLSALEHRCGSADRFDRCRRFLARRPVISQQDRFGRAWEPVTWNKVRELYEPVPEALWDRGTLTLCGTCGLPARAPRGERHSGTDTWCEGEDCPRGIPFRRLRKPGQCLILRRSLRVFLTLPSRTEQEVLDELTRIGAGNTLLPDSGLGTYHVTAPGSRSWYVQVHDRWQPTLLAGRVSESFAGAVDPVLVVVPRRAADRAGYRAAFETALGEESRARVTLTTSDDLERHLRPQDPTREAEEEHA
ncbi:hypothetical protein AB0L74_14060 [Streptomyces sp. NPDC052020]|uniref:pPIWI_RE_Y domain-containing protein n=1 Tax=Streptomyces sp. NPDC052020 TaxID=3155677 RepID=UPI003442C878